MCVARYCLQAPLAVYRAYSSLQRFLTSVDGWGMETSREDEEPHKMLALLLYLYCTVPRVSLLN